MTTSPKLNEQDLPQLAGAAVERALAARQAITELSAEQADLVGGARLSLGPVLQQPVLTIKPGDWAGPLLVQGINQFQTPVLNGAVQRQF
ncbi:hypothetical protein [Pseudorhodoferax sp. Leaf267]|uniref:hypothetical protein n=1 Tax=Pseudorhodoferax sp. Leaf267 TaxID=1736316 RepID=UPI0006F4552C|nr:hypothetical protein [Pseudorhodoferax sp. Leaf267]KQP21784.1 hypothetical protein ASF43_26150 [Pseudorhodoferax sp. Leaf267]